MTSKRNKKKERDEAIARARAWAIGRRKSKATSSGGVSGSNNSHHQQQQQQQAKRTKKINLLKIMLVKERRILEETKMKIDLIQNELDAIELN